MRLELEVAVAAAVDAGREIISVYESEDYAVEIKADESPLTKADRLAHVSIESFLGKTGLPILSEEGRAVSFGERMAWTRFWLVDPLDGTKEFISRNGEFTVNIALIDRGQPVLGVVYVPVSDELYYGIVGDGAYRVDSVSCLRGIDNMMSEAVGLPITHTGDPYRVVGSRSHLNEETLAFVEGLRTEHPEIEMVQRGSSLKICMVAAGDADCYPRFGPTMEWDTAAGHAVVRAAGKRMVVAGSDREVRYNKEELLNPFFVVR